MPSRERSIRAEAVVLRHMEWGEADRLLWLFTRELGKVRAVAKGVRKPHSRKAGHLEPFTRVNLLLARGREMLIVTQAEAVNDSLALREDLVRMGYASYVMELLDRFTYEEGENISLFNLLVDTLDRLMAGSDLPLAVHYYEIRLLDLVGFRPRLFRCASCASDIKPEDQFFSSDLGGVLCPKCGSHTPGVRPISMPALKVLRHLQRSSFDEASRIHPSSDVEREIENLMHHYLTYLLERKLNSPTFIRQVRQDYNAAQNDVADE